MFYKGLILIIFLQLSGCMPGHTKIGFSYDVNQERRLEAKKLSASNFQGNLKQKKQVVIVMIKGGYQEIDMYDETKEVISEFYYSRQYDLAHKYDEDGARRYMARERYQVSLDFYLQHRNEAFTPDEIATMRRLGFKETPAILIMDTSGNTLESYQGYDVPDDDDLHTLVCKYTSIVDEGLCSD